MNTYIVTLTYQVYNGTTATSGTLTFKKNGNSIASVIASSSAIFGALSNYVYDNGRRAIEVLSAEAYKVSSNDEPVTNNEEPVTNGESSEENSQEE